MEVNLPPSGSGAYLGICRASLKRVGRDYDTHKITLSPLQRRVIEDWVAKGEVSSVDLWAAFGATSVSKSLATWFEAIAKQLDAQPGR